MLPARFQAAFGTSDAWAASTRPTETGIVGISVVTCVGHSVQKHAEKRTAKKQVKDKDFAKPRVAVWADGIHTQKNAPIRSG